MSSTLNESDSIYVSPLPSHFLQLRTVTLIKPYNLGDFDSIQILISESESEDQNTSIAIFWGIFHEPFRLAKILEAQTKIVCISLSLWEGQPSSELTPMPSWLTVRLPCVISGTLLPILLLSQLNLADMHS